MRVALDTYALDTGQAGSARYTRGLLHALRTLAPADFTFTTFGLGLSHLSTRQPQRALRTIYRELIWAKALAPGQLRRQQIDLFHSTSMLYITPPAAMGHVATLYDLAVLRHPDRFRRWHQLSSAHRLKRLHTVDRIICISQFTADEAMACLNLPAHKLEVTYLGCDLAAAAGTQTAPELRLPSDFFLFVGSLEPGKNLRLLRATYEIARARGTHLPPLVIMGARWAGVATEGPPPADWTYLGWQPDEALVQLYRRALALVLPSKYEGFGLPVLEAMTLGCPVICSRVASLPEVGGDAALYAELTPESYLAAMQQLQSEAGLRAAMIARGHEQAKKFSWAKCAEKTLAVYRHALR